MRTEALGAFPAGGLTWSAPHPRCPGRGSVLVTPGCPTPRPWLFPCCLGCRPSPNADVCFPACSSLCTAIRVHLAEAGRSTWKRKRGRGPQAGLPTTRCETSGYNTRPGRCSDPSCLVLQPEGRRSAAESTTPPQGLDAARGTETAEGPAGWKVGVVAGGVARGRPAGRPLLGARSFSVRGFASAPVRPLWGPCTSGPWARAP